MGKPFDATLKHLLEKYPRDWLRLVGVEPKGRVELIDADLATVSASADKVFRVNDSRPWLLHLELQASCDSHLGGRLLQYNVLLDRRHNLPVRSVVILLRPEADGPAMSGIVQRSLTGTPPYLQFQYDVIRLWRLNPASILDSGVGTLPLLPLSDVAVGELPQFLEEMDSRFRHKTKRLDAASLWTATFVLMGLEYEEAMVSKLLAGVQGMKESVTYQAIVEEGLAKGRVEGRVEEARNLLIRLGSSAFGAPKARVRKTIRSISDLSTLEHLADRLMAAGSWNELLAELEPR